VGFGDAGCGIAQGKRARVKDSLLLFHSDTDFPSLDCHGVEQQYYSDIALCYAQLFFFVFQFFCFSVGTTQKAYRQGQTCQFVDLIFGENPGIVQSILYFVLAISDFSGG
jgi:hypothetical protein